MDDLEIAVIAAVILAVEAATAAVVAGKVFKFILNSCIIFNLLFFN